jgi:hypothetical protein
LLAFSLLELELFCPLWLAAPLRVFLVVGASLLEFEVELDEVELP